MFWTNLIDPEFENTFLNIFPLTVWRFVRHRRFPACQIPTGRTRFRSLFVKLDLESRLPELCP
jgi:hypothetical protein